MSGPHAVTGNKEAGTKTESSAASAPVLLDPVAASAIAASAPHAPEIRSSDWVVPVGSGRAPWAEDLPEMAGVDDGDVIKAIITSPEWAGYMT